MRTPVGFRCLQVRRPLRLPSTSGELTRAGEDPFRQALDRRTGSRRLRRITPRPLGIGETTVIRSLAEPLTRSTARARSSVPACRHRALARDLSAGQDLNS